MINLNKKSWMDNNAKTTDSGKQMYTEDTVENLFDCLEKCQEIVTLAHGQLLDNPDTSTEFITLTREIELFVEEFDGDFGQ